MFVFIPLVIIFLLQTYIYLHPDISDITRYILYAVMLIIVVVFYKLYKKIKADLEQQELNKIIYEEQQKTKHKGNK